MKHPLYFLILPAALALGAACPAWAERADRDKPMNAEADALRYDDLKQTSVFTGNVVITKGTTIVRGAQVDVSQDPEGYQQAIAMPLGDRAARIALEQTPPDIAAARRGFLQGGNHPDDIAGLIQPHSGYVLQLGTLIGSHGKWFAMVGSPRAKSPGKDFRLGATGFGALAALLGIGGGRLGGGARGLVWALQAQHQLDQLLLAQTLKLVTAHADTEAAKPAGCKGVGNCFQRASY